MALPQYESLLTGTAGSWVYLTVCWSHRLQSPESYGVEKPLTVLIVTGVAVLRVYVCKCWHLSFQVSLPVFPYSILTSFSNSQKLAPSHRSVYSFVQSSKMQLCWRRDGLPAPVFLGFPCGSAGKESSCNAGDLGSTGLGRSPGEGKGYPLQYSVLENSRDCIVHRVAKSQTWLNDFHFPKLSKYL